MHSDRQIFPQKPVIPLPNQGSGTYLHNAPAAPTFGGIVLSPSVKHSRPFQGFELQPSECCSKNFIIFDQSSNRSQIMLHPAASPKLHYPGLNINTSYIHDTGECNDALSMERELSSSLNEDSDDINALLSLEEEEQDEYDEEEVSTARTNGNCGSDSPDSCSSYGMKTQKSTLPSFQKSSDGDRSFNSEKKHQKVKNMVKVLRGIIPHGGNQMNTVTVLDEAVRYLKSLKVEAQKLGVHLNK